MPHSHLQEKTAHTKLAWVVVLTASLFFFYEFIQMNLFNAINTELREDFHLNAIQLGQFFSMYFYANALCLFPVGNIIDRVSTKKCLIFATSICTLGTFIFGIAHSYWLAAAGRFLVGCGASFCFLSCIRVASRWFPPQRMALVTGVIVTMAMLGGLIAQTPFALLAQYVGSWRIAILINTLLGVVILIVSILVLQDRPPDALHVAETDQHHLQALGLWRCIKLAALNPQNWLGGIYTSLMNLPVFVLGGLWGMHYLVEARHITLVQASYATTLFFVGVMIGSPVFGWISDRIGRRVLPMLCGAILSLTVMLTLMYVPTLSLTAVIALFFLIGFVTSSQVLTYPTVAELNPIFLTSTAVSIESICIMISGFVFPPFFGWLMEQGSQHEMVNGVTVYTAQDFNHAMLIMPVAFLASLAIAFFIRETYCRSQV